MKHIFMKWLFRSTGIAILVGIVVLLVWLSWLSFSWVGVGATVLYLVLTVAWAATLYECDKGRQ